MADGTDTPLMRPSFADNASGILVSSLGDQEVLDILSKLIAFFFPRPVQHYVEMEAEAFRALVLQAQDELNHRNVGRRLASDRIGSRSSEKCFRPTSR